MHIPEGVTLIKGEIADYYIEDDILVSLSKSCLRTVENITANVALVKEICQNKKMPLLIYLSNSPMPDKETRKLSTEKLPEIYTAMAMIAKPGLASLIMRVLFALKPPPIPMKQFTNVTMAKQWLQQYKIS